MTPPSPVALPNGPAPTDPFAYAGVGARATPALHLTVMRRLAHTLASRRWHLRTGGANGADTAFAQGAPAPQVRIYLPSAAYNGCQHPNACVPSAAQMRRLSAIAERHHDAWHRCSAFVRALHARNAAIVLGPDADTPVHALVCWTPSGIITGGTGIAIRIALSHDIPVFNLANTHPRRVLEALPPRPV